MRRFIQGLQQQQRDIDEMIARVDQLLDMRRSTARDGDRVAYKYIGDVIFPQQDSQARDIVFPIPEDTEFIAKSLSLYPFFRLITLDDATDGPDEISFRPCVLSSNEGSYFFTVGEDAASVDCFLSLSETYIDEKGQQINRAYQNMPFPVEFLRSGAVNYRSGAARWQGAPVAISRLDDYYAGFEFPSAYLFDCDYVLPPGSNFRITVSPNFAGVREDPVRVGANPALQNEYKLVAVLDGYKKVSR